MPFTKRIVMFAKILVLVVVCCQLQASAQTQFTEYDGTFSDGSVYTIRVPAGWNGTLLLYSHGYVTPGSPNPAMDVGDVSTGLYLLLLGYALAGSSFATTGWAIQDGFTDQVAVLDTFISLVGQPARTIAWGHSLGGIISAGLIQTFPERFSAALPMCGVLAGSVGLWNTGLDSAFAFRTLLGPTSGLQVVHISDPNTNLGIAEQILSDAQATRVGRARIALAAALFDTPGWFDVFSSEPAITDYVSREAAQFQWLQQVDFPATFAFRAELEARAHGNPSWNTGVDYEKQLERSDSYEEVRDLYRLAGLDLRTDLKALASESRIGADLPALTYLSQYIIFDGDLQLPVLTLHTSGDGLIPVENERAYKDTVTRAHNARFLRETFVHRAGHCSFTPAEQVIALRTLIDRLDSGEWRNVDPEDLNQAASQLGPKLNPIPPLFFDFASSPFLRPFDAFRTVNNH